jgi:hypothetical protein
VSQCSLNQRDRGASLQRMRGMSVAQPMRRHRISDSGSLRRCGHDTSNLAAAQGTIFATSEHRIIGMGQIIDRLQLQPGFAAEDNDARFIHVRSTYFKQFTINPLISPSSLIDRLHFRLIRQATVFHVDNAIGNIKNAVVMRHHQNRAALLFCQRLH